MKKPRIILSKEGKKRIKNFTNFIHRGSFLQSYVDQKAIMKVVNAVETKKRFARDANLIVRHIVEEIGELSRALYIYESAKAKGGPDATMVAKECVDVVSLCVYLCDVLGMDLDAVFPKRLKEVMDQYGVSLNGS